MKKRNLVAGIIVAVALLGVAVCFGGCAKRVAEAEQMTDGSGAGSDTLSIFGAFLKENEVIVEIKEITNAAFVAEVIKNGGDADMTGTLLSIPKHYADAALVGDKLKLRHNGVFTKSIPAQIGAVYEVELLK